MTLWTLNYKILKIFEISPILFFGLKTVFVNFEEGLNDLFMEAFLK